MEQEAGREERLFHYLLGKLQEQEMLHLEENYFLDDNLFDEVQAAERELIDRYVEGGLSKDERYQFEHFFLSTPSRQEKLRFARVLKEHIPAPVPLQNLYFFSKIRNSFSRISTFAISRAIAAASIIAILCVGLGVWRIFFYQNDVKKGRGALYEAYSKQRPLEARISRFNYAVYSQTRGEAEDNVDQLNLNLAEKHFIQAALDEPDAESYHALGQFYLAKRDFNRAIEYLEKAVSAAPNVAQIHADLGAAFFELGKSSSGSDDSGKSKELFAISLSHLNKALELEPSLHEALFNLALLYQEMKLPTDARKSWELYLKRDPHSKWAEEAGQKLKELAGERGSKGDDELYQDFFAAFNSSNHKKGWEALSKGYEAGWNIIVERLLREHLKSSPEPRFGRVGTALGALKFAADAEVINCGDRLTSDLAQSLLSLSAEQRLRLCEAEDVIEKARQEVANSDYRKAATYFQEASSILGHHGITVRSLYVENKIAHCYILDNRIDKAIEILGHLLRSCEDKLYLNLRARGLETLAIAYNYRKETSKELQTRAIALELYEKTGNINGRLQTYVYLAGAYQGVGNSSMSLNYLSRALDLIGRCPISQRELSAIYRAASGGFALIRLFEAAIAYQKECLKINLETGSPLRISRAYTFLGDLHRRNERYDAAVENIQLAVEAAKSVPNEALRKDMGSYALMYLGDAYRDSGDCERASRCYDEVILLNQQLKIPLWNYSAHKGKLLCYIARGDDPHIRSELDQTVKLYNESRTKILEDANKTSFGDREQSVFDIAIGYEFFNLNNPAAAFELAEENRARSFQDLLSGLLPRPAQQHVLDVAAEASSKLLRLSDLQARMPKEAQLLEYAVLDDRVIMWLVTSNGLVHANSPIGSEHLNDKVLGYLKEILNPHGKNLQDIEDQSKDLHTLLIKPIEDSLDKAKTLCIVPDKTLHYLPFNTLISRSSGNYLVKDFSLVYSLSANVLVRCSETALLKANLIRENLLCVGNPRFDPSHFTTLPDLPSARKEAETIARFYDAPATLLDQDATETAVKKAIVNCDVIHLATHYVTEEDSPLLSKLLLARSLPSQGNKEDGLLHAHELYTVNLRARLVVLSACQTGVERWYSGEGAIGIARPFLTSGVPLVVASLWKVDSESAAELMISFHKHRKEEKRTSADALRLAQLEMLGGDNRRFLHPYYWAAFAAVGGFTSF